MNRSLLALVCAGLLAAPMATEAATITLDDSYSGYLGSVDPHGPADLVIETYYINFLIGMTVSSTATVNDTPGPPPGDGHTFVRSANTCGQLLTCPAAGGAFQINSGDASNLDPTNWNFVLAKYGNAAYVWFVGDINSADVAQLPAKGPNQQGLAHYTVFNPVAVPDGGNTAGLLGLALFALAYLQRRNRKRATTA